MVARRFWYKRQFSLVCSCGVKVEPSDDETPEGGGVFLTCREKTNCQVRSFATGETKLKEVMLLPPMKRNCNSILFIRFSIALAFVRSEIRNFCHSSPSSCSSMSKESKVKVIVPPFRTSRRSHCKLLFLPLRLSPSLKLVVHKQSLFLKTKFKYDRHLQWMKNSN